MSGPDREDLDALAERYAADAADIPATERQRLREDFVRRSLVFARRVARRYRGRGEALDDLEQVACVGLVKAVDRYEPVRGSFTAYAVATITGELKRHFRDRTWGVHVPRRLQELSLEVGRGTQLLTERLFRPPTVAEIADHLRTEPADVARAIECGAGYATSSLNAPISDHGRELADLFGALDGDLDRADDRMTVARLLFRLPVRERRILALRFWGNLTQADIATELNISQMHVSRLLTRALTWLRTAMLSDTPPPWEAGEAPEESLRTAVTADRGTVTVRVLGEVDRDNADDLRRVLLDAAGAPAVRRVVVDFAQVPLLDAAGLGVLIAVHEAARVRRTHLRVVGLQPQVARIVSISGLDALVD